MSRNIILENGLFRLTVGEDCAAKSLVLKSSGEECLAQGEDIALFSVTQERPFNNEVKLAHPNKRTTYQANRVRREGDRLIVGFEIIPYEAVVEVKEASAYVAFTLVDFIVRPEDYGGLNMSTPPVAELRLVQLPVRARENFGEWLNVSWDDAAAVNVLATSPYARIDSERRKGYRVMTADAVRDIKLKNVGAALIVSETSRLLDAIATVEEDYDLPRGVESRRSGRLNSSAYHSGDITPQNVDEHIKYAKMGGFRLMLVYYTSIFKEERGYGLIGNYDFRDEYPNGMEDVRAMLRRIKDAGITPGIHILHSHIGLWSRYVSPKADHRLNLTRRFTLARPLDRDANTLYVEENPEGSVMADRCRILQFGGELIAYESYTTDRPYRFTGCSRGHLATVAAAHDAGQIGGILDVSEFGAVSCYLNQNSDLQEEIGDKVAAAYNAGFEFVYFDGSEGTNAPFEFHVPNAQYRVYKKFLRKPLFAEGAAKAHFSWHFLTGGNAFDVFPPEIFKAKIDQFPAEEAPRMRRDFTRLNFGWWGYWVPGTPPNTLEYGADRACKDNTPGTQPDMLEYGTSRAAAWDCPATITNTLDKYRANARTPDNLEVMRRWEDVRAKNWLTEAQKLELRVLGREHILLVNEDGEYELTPYEQIACENGAVRAFSFERKGESYVVYWHVYGEGTIELPLDPANITSYKELSDAALPAEGEKGAALLPIDGRRYVKSALPREELVKAFQKAKLR